MTLDYLERQNRGFYGFFLRFWAVRHISRVNCIEFTTNSPKQAGYKIFIIERRFQWSKSQPSRFKETCARGHLRAVPHKSHYFTIVGKSTMKTVADRHGYAAYHNNL